MRFLFLSTLLCLVLAASSSAGTGFPSGWKNESSPHSASTAASLHLPAPDTETQQVFRQAARVEMPSRDIANTYWENAPLAFFSLGSLAVGGVFYGIQSSMSSPRVGYVAGDRTTFFTAVGAAGLTSLIAGGAYFYFCHKDLESNRNWNTQVSGGTTAEGHALVSAALTFRLPLVFF